jgi:hypothetical protein
MSYTYYSKSRFLRTKNKTHHLLQKTDVNGVWGHTQTNATNKMCRLKSVIECPSKQAIHVVTTVLYTSRYDIGVSVSGCTTYGSACNTVQSVTFIYCRSTSVIPLSSSLYLYGAILCSLYCNNMYNAYNLSL